MAITVTSQYKPFTYEELVKPLEGYWKKYDKAEEDLGNLSTQLAALDYIVESEPEDSPLRAKYSNYKAKLETAAETLGQRGLTQEVRNLLKETNASFAKDISPIATQYARRQKLEDEQRKIKTSNPSVYFSKRAAETSLAEMMENPNWSYTSFVGNDITKAVQDMVSPVATILENIWKDGKVGDYDKILSKYGISPEDVSAYFNGEFKGSLAKFFDDARNTVIKAYGIDTWEDADALNAAYKYANMGIPKAIGKLTPQLIASKNPTGGGDKKGGSGEDFSTAYPGNALNFDVSTRYIANTERASKATHDKKYNQGISVDLRHTDVAKMEAQFKDAGLNVADLEEYENYLAELAEANRKDTIYNHVTPSSKAVGFTKHVANLTPPNADNVRQKYDHKYDQIEKKISRRDINKYRKAVAENKEFIKRYSIGDNDNVDNRTGLYTDNVRDSINIGTQLEEKQSQEEMFIGTHKWGDTTKKAIIGQLKSQYESLRATNNLNPSKKYSTETGNGLYEISFDNGAMSTKGINPDEIPTEFWDNADVVFTAQHGMLIQYRNPSSNKTTMYKLKGSAFTKDSEEVADVYRESRDFSPESIKSYSEIQNKQHGTEGYALGSYDLVTLLDDKQSAELVQTLRDNKAIVRSSNNSNYGIAYVQAIYPDSKDLKWTVAKVVIDLRTGEKVSVTTVDNELGTDGLGYSLSTKYAQNKLQGIAYTKSNDALNLNTGVATRTKGSNPIKD